MDKKIKGDLREILIDAHAHFFFLKGDKTARLKLWQILPDSIIVDSPFGAPMIKTILGYIPSIDGESVYEVEGQIAEEKVPHQPANSLRIEIDFTLVKKINKRLYPRVSFTPPINAQVSHKGSKEKIAANIVNFSAGGLRIESAKELTADKEYKFDFEVEIDEEVNELQLTGVVVYEIPIETGFSYGVKFGKMAEKQTAKEATVEELGQTVDLLRLVNKLLVREV